MHFQQLTHLDTVSLEKIFDSYELSFPADERRSEVQFQALIKNHDATIFAIDVEARTRAAEILSVSEFFN